MYNNIKIILGTKHKKEQAIQEPFESAFSASVFVPTDFDTDQFGTFTGETPRMGTAVETAITKAKQAANIYGYHYSIASEGSFGPHPSFFCLPADVEIMVFVDLKQDIVISDSVISTQTNFSHLDIRRSDDYREFLARIKFGSHGLILKSAQEDSVLAKGIVELTQLENLLNLHFQEYSVIRLETDMRAMMNPTRMNLIHQLANKLVARIKTPCKACNTPGFGKRSTQGNLLCKDCGTETQFYKSLILSCIKCAHSEIKPRDDGLTHTDPMYCSYCNP